MIYMRRTDQAFIPSSEHDNKALEGVSMVICFDADNVDDRLRRECQNRLYWWWIKALCKTEVNEYAGWEKEEWHGCLKREVLSPLKEQWARQLFEEGKAENGGWFDLIESIRVVYSTDKATGMAMFDHVIAELSTRSLSVSAFSKYLKAVDDYCAPKGIRLPADNRLEELAGVQR